jgi:hypothetical protein
LFFASGAASNAWTNTLENTWAVLWWNVLREREIIYSFFNGYFAFLASSIEELFLTAVIFCYLLFSDIVDAAWFGPWNAAYHGKQEC